MRQLVLKYKWWIFIAIAFLLVRIFVFDSFWQASLNKGGWQNFYDNAQAAPSVLQAKFHEVCDWHPPLYYVLTSALLVMFKTQWAIYLAQILLTFFGLIISYKIAKLFFSEGIALAAVFLLAIEPYWAWHNFLLVSENLSTPLLLLGLYYLFKFLRYSVWRDIAYSAIFFGLATLTRPNYLLLPFSLSVLLAIIVFFKNRLGLTGQFKLNFRKYLFYFFIFNILFLAVLAPWLIRNQIVYGRLTLANIMSTNIYLYNLPPFIAWQKGISYEAASNMVINQAIEKLGPQAGSFNGCEVLSKAEFNRQLNFYETEAKQYILSNLPSYLVMHSIRAIPFFLQPGYFEMWSAYSGEFNKPDISTLVLKHDWAGIKAFVTDINLKFVVYGLGVIFWGLASLASLIACVYSWRRDRGKFLFFLLSFGIILYNALIISPFVLARYRLPIYILFFIPLVYLIAQLKIKKSSNEKKL